MLYVVPYLFDADRCLQSDVVTDSCLLAWAWVHVLHCDGGRRERNLAPYRFAPISGKNESCRIWPDDYPGTHTTIRLVFHHPGCSRPLLCDHTELVLWLLLLLLLLFFLLFSSLEHAYRGITPRHSLLISNVVLICRFPAYFPRSGTGFYRDRASRTERVRMGTEAAYVCGDLGLH